MRHRNTAWRELLEKVDIETEVIGFVGNTVHAYDHRMLALLASTAVYRSGTFVLHNHAAVRWVSVAALDAYDVAAADRPIVR